MYFSCGLKGQESKRIVKWVHYTINAFAFEPRNISLFKTQNKLKVIKPVNNWTLKHHMSFFMSAYLEKYVTVKTYFKLRKKTFNFQYFFVFKEVLYVRVAVNYDECASELGHGQDMYDFGCIVRKLLVACMSRGWQNIFDSM